MMISEVPQIKEFMLFFRILQFWGFEVKKVIIFSIGNIFVLVPGKLSIPGLPFPDL